MLPWAQGTQARPVGLSMPTFDVDDDDDDLIDWGAAPVAAPTVTTSQPTAPALSMSAAKNGNANGHTKK